MFRLETRDADGNVTGVLASSTPRPTITALSIPQNTVAHHEANGVLHNQSAYHEACSGVLHTPAPVLCAQAARQETRLTSRSQQLHKLISSSIRKRSASSTHHKPQREESSEGGTWTALRSNVAPTSSGGLHSTSYGLGYTPSDTLLTATLRHATPLMPTAESGCSGQEVDNLAGARQSRPESVGKMDFAPLCGVHATTPGSPTSPSPGSSGVPAQSSVPTSSRVKYFSISATLHRGMQALGLIGSGRQSTVTTASSSDIDERSLTADAHFGSIRPLRKSSSCEHVPTVPSFFESDAQTPTLMHSRSFDGRPEPHPLYSNPGIPRKRRSRSSARVMRQISSTLTTLSTSIDSISGALISPRRQARASAGSKKAQAMEPTPYFDSADSGDAVDQMFPPGPFLSLGNGPELGLAPTGTHGCVLDVSGPASLFSMHSVESLRPLVLAGSQGVGLKDSVERLQVTMSRMSVILADRRRNGIT